MKVAAAPVSWGVFENAAVDPRVPSPDAMLDSMAEAGYAGTELGPRGFLGRGTRLRERVEARGLALVGAFLPLRFSRREFAEEDRRWLGEALEELRDAAPDGGSVTHLPKAILSDADVEPERLALAGRVAAHRDARLPRSRFSVLVDNVHRAADACRDEGFDALFHSHAGSYVETEDELRRLIDSIDPGLVGLCLDTGHARFGGGDPAELAREYAELIRHVHLKDLDPDVLAQGIAAGEPWPELRARGIFVELGKGDAGIDRVVATLRDAAYDGWLVVEQDRVLGPGDSPATLTGAQRRNRDYLRQLGA